MTQHLRMETSALSRRSFITSIAGAAAGTVIPTFADAAQPSPARTKIKLGMDNFAVRAMEWKAPQLLSYAASLKLDTLFISDLDAYESLDDGYLKEIKARADELKLELYAGSWSICPTSKRFKNTRGAPEEHVATGLRVARALGSPVIRFILGGADDRKSEGGIRARIADTVKVLKASESMARDAGVKISIENHGGDMHSWELIDLIEQAGKHFVGANIDTGNGAWTLEDPLDLLERLGPYVNCSSLRDAMVWQTPDGASVGWTAAGEGLIDWKGFVTRWKALCPSVPIQIETISGIVRNFPYKTDEFWKTYDRRPDALAKFEAFASKGREFSAFKAPEGAGKKQAEQEFQKAELERSIRYLREVVGIGLKT